jgi:hypothetical protein
VVQINAYADDDVIIATNLKALEEALQQLDTSEETGIIINQETTKHMQVRRHTISVIR